MTAFPIPFPIFLLLVPAALPGCLRLSPLVRFVSLALRSRRLLLTLCGPWLLPLLLYYRAALLRRGVGGGCERGAAGPPCWRGGGRWVSCCRGLLIGGSSCLPRCAGAGAPLLPAAESAGGRPCHAAGNDNAGCGAYAAAPPGGDTGLLNTAAGRRAAGRAPEQGRAATCPIRFDAAPIHGPSADPSGAAHSTASRGSTRGAAGSSARGHAG